MKKVTRLIACLIGMMMLLTSVPVHAEESSGTIRPDVQGETVTPEFIYPSGDLPEPRNYETDRKVPNISTFSAGEQFSTEAELYQKLENEVKEALLEGKTEVDVSRYGIDVSYKLYALAYFSPYLGMNMTINAYYSGNQYVFLQLNNSMSIEETKEYFSKVDKKVDEILSVISDDMTDLEKALTIHDYLVYHGAYDYENYINGTLPEESYSSAGMFMKGTGVCNAYAYGYQYLMTKLGIECHVTSSDPMNHAWNIISIDGQYYHVDCTWDDPVPDNKGKVYHEYFLVSDSAMLNERGHYEWDRTDLVCSDTSYDNAYWVDTDTQIIILGNKSYYMINGYIYCKEGDNITQIADAGIWPVWGNSSSWWTSAYSGLFYKNGYLYYNTYSSIRRIYVNAEEPGKTELVYQPDLSEGYVYGIYMEGGELIYVIKQSYLDEGTIHTAPVSMEIQAEKITLNQTEAKLKPGETLQLIGTVEPGNATEVLVWSSSDTQTASVDGNGLVTAKGVGNAVITVRAGSAEASCTIAVEAMSYVTGDVNSDGTIDITDLRLVLRSVCGKIELTQQQTLAADTDKNSKVDINDLRKMLRFICRKIDKL